MKHRLNFKGIQAKILMISLGVLAVSGCRTSTAPSATGTTSISTWPFVIDPPGTTITGGMLLTNNGCAGCSKPYVEDPTSTSDAMLWNYNNYQDYINVKLDGVPMRGYGDVDWGDTIAPTSAPFWQHTWEISSDLSNGVPAIYHTMRGFTTDLVITSPSDGDTIGDPTFTIYWTPSHDSGSKIYIAVSYLYQGYGPPPYYSYGSIVPDNGSHTFSTSLFQSGISYYADIERYIYDCDTIAGRSYVFINVLDRSCGIFIR